MSFADQFHLPDGPYLLSHSVGCLPKAAQKSLEGGFLQPWSATGGGAWPNWLRTIEGFCEALGTLLDVQAADICPQQNVSAGFANYLGALPKQGRTKIIMHADAFPTMGFVVQGLKAAGLELLLINASEAADDLDTWERHLDETVLAALITHVHSNTGVVSPVKAIADLCRTHDVRSTVDVAQSVGIMPVNPIDWGVDALFGSCVKWLGGGPGAGYLWIDPTHAEKLLPPHVGWFSHADPFEFDIRSFTPATGARRFWGGTPSVAPYAIAKSSIETLREIGFDAVRNHNLMLRKIAVQSLEQASLTMRPVGASGGTLCLNMGENADHFDGLLKKEGCHFDRRGSTIRLSFHIFNTEEEAKLVNQLLSSL